MLCDITCTLEFVGNDISAADVKHMIWKFQNAGVILISSYVYCLCVCVCEEDRNFDYILKYRKNFLSMGSNTGKSDVTILQHMCYAIVIVFVAELSLMLESLCSNG